MKTLQLKTLGRIYLLSILNDEGKAGNHTLSELNRYFKLIDKVDFSTEEREALALRTEGDKILWNLHKKDADGKDTEEVVDVPKEVEFSSDDIKLLLAIWKKRDEEKKFGLSDYGAVTELAGQIGYVFGE